MPKMTLQAKINGTDNASKGGIGPTFHARNAGRTLETFLAARTKPQGQKCLDDLQMHFLLRNNVLATKL